MHYDFSVLLSIYKKEMPEYLQAAMESIWDTQLVRPNQIVLVRDGPLTSDLDYIINNWHIKLGDILTVVRLEVNGGLAAALNEGLKYCKYELVARMDTDDIAMPVRFEKQYSFMQSNLDVAVCSGLIEEWSQDFSYKISVRELPLNHSDIIKFAKFRSPISHPAAMFRKAAVLSVEGYPEIYPEDYLLWGKMIHNGSIFANLPDLILKMRVGNALVDRRGIQFFKGEVLIYRYFLKIGFINVFEYWFNIFSRGIVRLSPNWIKRIFYKYFR